MGHPWDAAVIGSGPNGLCAAIRLAQAGMKVLVLERADTPGGGARTAQLTLPGFAHDVCSAIHPMAAGSPFMRALGLKEHGLTWIHPPAPLAHPLDDGPAVLLERDLAATDAQLDAVDGGRWSRWMEPLTSRWDDLAPDAMAALGVPRHPLLMARLGLRGLRSAAGLARSEFRGPRARALFGGIAAHSVLPLDEIPSAAIGVMLGVAAHAVGWPLPQGGAQAITNALIACLRRLGGEVLLGHEVRQLEDVPTEGPVLFDTGPRALASIANNALPAGYLRKLERFRYGPGVFKIDWALDGPIPWRDPACARAATVHLGGTLEEMIRSERAAWSGQLVERPYVLLAQQSLFDPSRAPEGKHTGWAYCHVPAGSTADRTEAIEQQVERFAPGFRERILARHIMNSQQMQAHNPNYVGGDVNGGAATLDQLFFRPVARRVPYQTPHRRLYLCSASTPPGGGVHGMCGVGAAEAALKRWG